MATENEEFDEGAFGNEDDGDEVSDEDDVIAIEKSADPFLYGRLRRGNYQTWSSSHSP